MQTFSFLEIGMAGAALFQALFKICEKKLFGLDDVHDSGHDQMRVQAWTHGMHEREEPVGVRQENG